MRAIRLHPELAERLHRWGGTVVLVLLGVAVCLESLNYPLGSLAQVGPGAFPMALGLLLVGLGLALFWDGATEASRAPFVWRPLIAICSAMVAFGALMELSGAIAAATALVAIAELAEPRYNPVKVVVLAAALTAFLFLVTFLLSDTLLLKLY